MKNSDFCHLHVHTEHSLLDGYGSAKQYVKKAKELGFTHLGITDHGNIDGLIKFQKECDKNGIVPVMGCEAYIVPDLTAHIKGEKRGHVTLLIKNQKGFVNLCKMLTAANLKGFYSRPRIDFNLLYDNCEGLVVLTGCSSSFLMLPGGQDLYLDLMDKITSDIYLELMPHDLQEQKVVNRLCLGHEGQIVATNDCHYVEEDDWKAQEVLLAIQTKALWSDKDRYKFSVKGLFLRSADEMVDAFVKQGVLGKQDIEDAFYTTKDISRKCGDFRIKKQEIYLPTVPGYEQVDPEKFLWDLCIKKMESDVVPFQQVDRYLQRAEEEWAIIKGKKFVPYFMVVYELVQYCKENDIMIGPGRGSVGGCLVAYLLGITMVDPIKYDLLFSRFITEDRTDLPDIDLDFEDSKRHLIREHFERLYGKNNISSISTFMTMKGRGAVRDVARVFGIPLTEVDEFAKKIDDAAAAGKEEDIILDAVTNTDEGKAFDCKYPEVVDLAIKLEGQIRGAGQHAAAVVISADDLTQGARGNLVMRSKNIVSNWDMEDSEFVGLMKLDVLGLNTLSILNEARRLIAQNKEKLFLYHPGSDSYFVGDQLDLANITDDINEVDFDFDKIPLDDPKVYEEISAGHNVGVFQLSAWATSRLATHIKPDNLDLLGDVVALVRPGPFDSGMTDEYLKRRGGETWVKKHPIYEEITRNTYGIVAYQEQVMQVFHKVAGLSYATADKIRKVIGKKRDAREFKPFKDMFVKGCLENKTLSEGEALDFWEALQFHARYSFNRSHSIEYAIIGYWTAWLKLYFPTEFLCANLTYGSDGKKEEIIEECYRLGLQIQLPRVGISDAMKWVTKDKILYVPFIEIKGIGEKTAFECTLMKQKTKEKVKGFFNLKISEHSEGKLEKILTEIGAFGQKPLIDNLSSYFSFRVKQDSRQQYPNLKKILGFSFPESDLNAILKLDVPVGFIRGMIWESRPFVDYIRGELKDCYECPLGSQCKAPVKPSPGKYNLMICGEAPGRDEDEQGKGFVGRTGEQILWPELAKYELYREDFHLTNCCKCFPYETKTPNKEEIMACWKWLKEEIDFIQPRLILAFGNVNQRCFTGRDGGIISLSGETEWVERVSAWVCWSVHPSSVLHNATNREVFQKGVKNFSDRIRTLGDIK